MDGFAEDMAPPASHFPPYPLSWYFFGLSREVPRNRPVAGDILGRRSVAYRTGDGRAVTSTAVAATLAPT